MAKGDVIDSFVSSSGAKINLLDNGLTPEEIAANRRSMDKTLSRLFDEEVAYRLANGISIDSIARVVTDAKAIT